MSFIEIRNSQTEMTQKVAERVNRQSNSLLKDGTEIAALLTTGEEAWRRGEWLANYQSSSLETRAPM